MSLVPLLLSEYLDNRRTAIKELIDQHFGMVLPEDFMALTPTHSLLQMPFTSGYLRPWRHIRPSDSGVSIMTDDKNEFKVNLDVQQFKPEELKVTIDNGYLIVNGKHEERSDEHGFISRQFTRRYMIPQDVDQKALVSKLSSDGVLSLSAPKLKKEDEHKVIELTIHQTNQPLRIKDQGNTKSGQQEETEAGSKS